MKNNAEVVIIGGGIIGCATAYYLAKEGVSVIVLEKSDHIGNGGSSRNGGGVRQSGRDPRELPLAMYAVEHMWPTLSEELGVDVEYHKEGNLRLGKTAKHKEILQGLTDRAVALGLDVRMIDGKEVREINPYLSEEITVASWCPTDGHANPLVATLGFYKRARELGAEFITGEDVLEIQKIKGKARRVVTEKNVYEGETIVLASGYESRSIAASVGIDIPMRKELIEALVTEAEPKMFPQMLGTADADFYGHQTNHGSFVFGGASGFEAENRDWNGELKDDDDKLARGGRIMDSMLSEHMCEGWLEGYLLTGRHGFFASYEAFIRIVDSMAAQHAKWLKVCNQLSWRQPIASLNFILSSNVWQQDHNGYTHQDPGFLDHIANKKADVVRMYLPPDTNCLLSCFDHCIRSKNYVNAIVASKHPSCQWLSMEQAVKHCTQGIGIWEWASNDCGEEPDLVMACCGDTPTLETMAAVTILRDELPELKIRVVNVVDLFKLESNTKHPHGLSDAEYDAIFTKDTPVIFAFHGYPTLIHELTYGRNNHNVSVHGYQEEGTITTPFDMRVQNQLDRFDLVKDAIMHLPQLGNRGSFLIQKMNDKLVKKLGADRIEIQEFPAGQIGSEERSFQDVQQGILQMTVLAVNNASIFAPSLGAFDLPYIFKSVKEFDDCVDQNWDLINKRMEAESGTIAIAWHSQGFRFITNSKQPVAKLADLAPVKIRTPNNPIMIGVYRAWGTDPVPMAMDETFNALQQKVVDGQDNPLVSIATNRFYEVQKYITEPHYKLWTGPVVVNVDWLRSLPADVQQAIIEAGHETTVEMRALLDKQESASREFLKEKGMVFCGVPTDEDEWMKRAVSIWPQFYPQIKNLEIVEAFMKTLGRQLPR